MKIKTLRNLEDILDKEIGKLMEVAPAYLSDAGKAAGSAYRAVLWYCSFYDTLEELAEDEEFRALYSIPNKHPEYYNVIRKINRVIEKALS